MIVKNEEKNIERALSWGKGIVSEQIVVDTGSTDRTVELAQAMGAKVYHFEWIDDFAAAKNYAIDQASGDWILFLDADEYFTKEDAKKIPAVILQMEKMKIRKKKVDVVVCALCNLDENGNVKEMVKQARLFRNLPHIRYIGRIHEDIMGLKKRVLTRADVGEALMIYHTGYAWTPQLREEKMDRNITLLQKELERNPDNAENQLYLAESLLAWKRYEEAVEYAKRALGNSDHSLTKERLMKAHQIVLYGTYYLIRGLNREDDPEAFMQLYENAVAFAPDCPEYDGIMGYYMYDGRQYTETVFYLEQMLEKMKKKESYDLSWLTSRMESNYRLLAMSYGRIGNYEKFFSYAVQALQLDSRQDILIGMLLRYLTECDPATTEEIYQFLHQIYDFNSQKDVLYLLRMAIHIGNKELAKLLEEDLTEENKSQLFPVSDTRK
jgi:glycosyltransferase involved in cell wall biosynthesis